MRDEERRATSGHFVQNLDGPEAKPSDRLRPDDDRPRPSERLRQDGDPAPVDDPAPAGKAAKTGKRGRPRPSERLRREDGGRLPDGGRLLDDDHPAGHPAPDGNTAVGGKDAKPGKENPAPQSGGAEPAADPGGAVGSGSAGGAPRGKQKKLSPSERHYEKAGQRVEQAGAKLEKAKGKLAKQKPRKKPGPIRSIGRAVQLQTWRYAHGKIRQVEQENVGTEAAHKAELAGEGLVRGGTGLVKRRLRTRPMRQVRKWERKHISARAGHEFHRLAQEHPELNRSAASRLWQKQKLKWKYQKQARAAKQGGKTAKKAVDAAGRFFRAVLLSVKRHPIVLLMLGLVLALLMLLQSCAGAAVSLFGGLSGAVGGSSYMAEDMDINEAELAYCEWETDLLLEAKNAEQSHPGYDEYVFDLDEVGHDPHLLMSFLTAKYDAFTFAQVEPVLRDIFAQQYSLTFNEIVEERGDEENGYYDYYILEVTLTAKPFADIIAPLLTAQDERDRYELYNDTKGNRAYVGSPFPFDWLPYVSSHFGWRTHPVTGARDFHRAIDIAVPTGTEILAGGKGVVAEATTHSLYGLTVKIDYGAGITARYSHCSSLLVSSGQEVEPGQAIALVGDTGQVTGPHLDLEVLKDGELLNPLYFVVIPR